MCQNSTIMTEVINRNHYSDWHLLIYVKCNELSFATPLRNDQTCELRRTAETLRGYFRVFFFFCSKVTVTNVPMFRDILLVSEELCLFLFK